MASKLFPRNPAEVMVIRELTPNITICSLPFARFGWLKMGARTTIVRLSSGGVAVFSPGPLVPPVQEVVNRLGNGNVRHLIAPDSEHYLYLAKWAAAYPSAILIGPSLLSSKLSVALTKALTKENQREIDLDQDFLNDFDYEFVPAAANEIVLYFKPDQTLLVADLMMNLPATEQYSKTQQAEDSGLMTRACNGMRGVEGQPLVWQRRLVWAIASADRKGFDASINRTASWQLEKIVVCHGEVIEKNATRIWQSVFLKHIQESK